MQLDSAQLAELAVAKRWQEVTLEVLFILRLGRVLQIRPRQFATLIVDSSHSIIFAFEELGFIVPGVDLLHKLVSLALGLPLTWHLTFRPRLGTSPPFTTVGVIPIIEFPLGPKVLNLGPFDNVRAPRSSFRGASTAVSL